jgi:hypothetical protein
MSIRKDKKLVGMEDNNRYFETFVNRGRVKLASPRSPRWNCRSWKFSVQDAHHRTRRSRLGNRQPNNCGHKIG